MGLALPAVLADPTEQPGRRTDLVVAAAVAVAGAATCALTLAAPALRGFPVREPDQAIHATVAACYIGAGVVARVRRPRNATGLLMVAVGFLWLVSDLGWVTASLTFTVAATYDKLYQPVLGHLALAFPSGRLPGRLERRVMVGVYVWSLLNNVVRMMFLDPRADGCGDCPDNLLLVRSDPAALRTVEDITTVVSVVLILGVAALVVRHWRRATRAARHVMAPVLWAVPPTVAYLVGSELADLVGATGAAARFVYDVMPLGLAVLPIGFLLGLLRTRLAYAGVGAMGPALSGPLGPGRVRAALARSLHDPTLELLYWSPATDTFVDIDGHPRDLPDVPGRVVRHIDGETGPLAAIVVDEAVLTEPGLLDAAAAMARLALENDRLHAEVRSQLLQLRSTSARLVEAGQDARRRIERDLHDGAQQRLLSLSMALGQARARLDSGAGPETRVFLDHAADDLQRAITELRELARGIHPVLLTQEGLASALQALAERAPVPVRVSAPTARFSDTIESTAYFLVSEAVTNASRHSGATVVTVDVTQQDGWLVVRVEDDGIGGADVDRPGSGLQGMRDRVVAVGGRLTLSSPPGAGTTVVARLPCG